MTKPVLRTWVRVPVEMYVFHINSSNLMFLVLSAWTLKKAHIISYHEAQTIPDCIRYIICVFCYNFKSQTNILASY